VMRKDSGSAFALMVALCVGGAATIARATLANVIAQNIQQTAVQPAIKLDGPQVYEHTVPSVVEITVLKRSGHGAQGSGVIVKSNGFIVTNYHVIADAVSARVQLHNGDIYDTVEIAETDERKDLAVLKIKASDLPSVSLAPFDTIKVGSTLYALGSPRGLEGSLSQGVVSSIRPISDFDSSLSGFRVIQFTAPVSPGSSGGPLVDEFGRLVGVVSSSLTGSQNINLGIPVKYIDDLLESFNGSTRVLEKMPISPVETRAVKRSPDEIIGSSKTLYVWSSAGSLSVKTEISNKLRAWGGLTLVELPEDADLILQVEQTGKLNSATGEGAEASAVLIDAKSRIQLWAKTKGGSWSMTGFSISRASRAVADELIKFFKSVKKEAPPKS
jgi:S1-C subfamily serine protease